MTSWMQERSSKCPCDGDKHARIKAWMLNQFGICSKNSSWGLHCEIRSRLNHIHWAQEKIQNCNESCCESREKTAELATTIGWRRRHRLQCQWAICRDPPSLARAHKNPQKLRRFPPAHHLSCKINVGLESENALHVQGDSEETLDYLQRLLIWKPKHCMFQEFTRNNCHI